MRYKFLVFREQGAGSREQAEQGAGSREQGAGSREQGAGSREQEQEQGAGSRSREGKREKGREEEVKNNVYLMSPRNAIPMFNKKLTKTLTR
ncbi:hypothetical protein BJP34_10695 [Moorena producens PAL-8-15-08-1]|uniref:Uncharacterized protein n=1 Tax=Moorena producens PAL-8-15-08-1 TaxID=1458985 RepID=A0A1D8TQD5_9CYAN|nr:hypothetical protein BJP34_10695 [Moorena producens PAL-8-15-08-1]